MTNAPIKTRDGLEQLLRMYIKDIIWSVTKVELPFATFLQTSRVIDDQPTDLNFSQQSIINGIKRSFETVLDFDRKFDVTFVKDIAFNVLSGNSKPIHKPGVVRSANIRISGTTYIPKPVSEKDLEDLIEEVNNIALTDPKLAAATWVAKATKAQFFDDGNKRTSLIVANKILLDHEEGIFILNAAEEKLQETYFKHLQAYYEDENHLPTITQFLIDNGIKNDYSLNYITEEEYEASK